MARYEIWLTTDTGRRLALLDDVLWMQATRVVSDIGQLNLGVKPSFDLAWLAPDQMVQVWRAPTGGRLALWRAYFLRAWRFETQGSVERLTLRGSDANDLLRRRVVAYATDTSEGAKSTTEADDLIKEVIDENMVSCATTARNWSALSVQVDLSDGPSLDKNVGWRQVDNVLRDVSKASYAAGTEVFYDVVESDVGQDSISLQFRTYTGQPGQDLTSRGALFSQDRRNLVDPYYEVDYSAEVNYVYGLGQGEGSDRTTQEVSDAGRIAASAWNRCEAIADARNESTDNGTREAARAVLTEGRPRRRAGGKVLDTEGVRFGRDWQWGDKVTFKYREEFDCIVRAVVLSLGGDGKETVQARLDYEE